ncbi:MAG: tRNA 2-thiouridine(34) synthase MnmA [Candidatus Marinimicrobia bacterium]|nr:tRNA 2-thiouridine(34) synthase MnmA [Candidatus Neomarinimicrobiota bacterium]MCF7829187.1 tRNA 2-thiouridine(34) synthase MnmA [Candidatus Neomarinimicrobiota bacterium]MCF7881160.1 tRNA 2-thiouridine(34) synthase MnmA [Candidatus Neomarinimicrobiota bacterium]
MKWKPDKGERVVAAMSGGVDSSLMAKLLLDQGYDVIGVTMKLWTYERVGGNTRAADSNCCSIEEINDARMVCHQLGIPHYVLDFSDTFHDTVVENFVSEYLNGSTPNPCVLCNSRVRWVSLLDRIGEFGAEFIATGHYARRRYNPETDAMELLQGLDPQKDQSYVLWGVNQDLLRRTLWPLGNFTKETVRSDASDANLHTAQRPESFEICFVADNDYRRFLSEYATEEMESIPEGEIVDTEGNVLGMHEGYPNYTIGQRRGLGIAIGEPVYVKEIRPETNRIVVGKKQEVLSETCEIAGVNYTSGIELITPTRVRAAIRYNHRGADATLVPKENNTATIEFDEPQHAITPGQSAVFYRDDLVLGGGFIKQAA